MKTKTTLLLLLFITLTHVLHAQKGIVKGFVKVNGQEAEFAQVQIESSIYGATCNSQGEFIITNIPYGTYHIMASYIGYNKIKKSFTLSETQNEININFDLTEQTLQLEDVVVTATKTPKRITNSPIIVNVINSKTLDDVYNC